MHFLRLADGNGLLDLDEFEALMEKDFVHKRMRDLEINMRREELMKTFGMLDVDDSGELTIEEFVDGLGYLHEGLATKHIVNVDYSLKRVEKRVETRFELLSSSATEVAQQHEDILRRMRRQRMLHDQAQTPLWLFRTWAAGRASDVDGLEAALCVLPPTMSPQLAGCHVRQSKLPSRRRRGSQSSLSSARRGSEDVGIRASDFRVGEEVLLVSGEFTGQMAMVRKVQENSISVEVGGREATLTSSELADGTAVLKAELAAIHSPDRW